MNADLQYSLTAITTQYHMPIPCWSSPGNVQHPQTCTPPLPLWSSPAVAVSLSATSQTAPRGPQTASSGAPLSLGGGSETIAPRAGGPSPSPSQTACSCWLPPLRALLSQDQSGLLLLILVSEGFSAPFLVSHRLKNKTQVKSIYTTHYMHTLFIPRCCCIEHKGLLHNLDSQTMFSYSQMIAQ